jgi:hypothetical protein
MDELDRQSSGLFARKPVNFLGIILLSDERARAHEQRRRIRAATRCSSSDCAGSRAKARREKRRSGGEKGSDI